MSTGTTTRARVLALLVALPLLLGLTAWTPTAHAAPAHRTTVTIALGSPGAGRLLPRAATRTRVVARLQAHGFRVLGTTSWSVTASAPSRVVAATFGPDRSAARASAVLGAGVSGVAPEQEGLLQPLATTTGADYRNAYAATATSGVTHGHTVSTGQGAGNTTVATIQFAQFDASDLTRYAASQNLPDPVASGQYSGVVVDGGPTDADGAIEVALDQEAILATSPTARQRAYFAPNTTSGFADALQAVANDAAAYHITTLSISWGNCESKYDAVSRKLLDKAFGSLLSANGVTVFSSSGDSGVYGCRTSAGTESTVAVTYPASSLNVVGVGGTKLDPVGTSAANNGANWTETGWSCTTLATCTKGGSGGGSSAAYAKPTWQSGSGSGSQRQVPDISAIGDPGTGFVVSLCGTRYAVGGTSLASPVAAALFTDALSEAGWTTGVGDIHTNLYKASTSTFRDITSGSNGPSSTAGTGYDTVTGRGSVLWPKLVNDYYATPTASTSAMAAAVPNTVTWPLCSASTGTTTATTATPTTPTTPTADPGPTARAVLTPHHSSRHRVRVVARWSVVRRSSAALAATRVVVTDLTTGRILARATSRRGARSVVVPSGHRVSLAVLPRDVNGAGNLVRVARRVR